MEFIGGITQADVVDQRVGVFLRSSASEIQSIGAELFSRDGKLFIDCIPLKRRKYVAPVPDSAVIAKAADEDAPYPFAVFILADTEAGALIRRLLEADVSRN